MLLDILFVCFLVNWQSTVLYQLKRRVLREVQSKKKNFAAIKEIQETSFGFRRRDIQQMSEKNVLWIYLTAKYEPEAVSFVTSSVTQLVILSPMHRLETVMMVTVVAVAKPATSVAELRFQSRLKTSLRVQFAKYSRVETRGEKCCQILSKNFGSEAQNS